MAADVLLGGEQRLVGGVALRRQRQVNRRLREVDPALGQPDAVDGRRCSRRDGERLRGGVADVLGGEDHHPAGDEARILAAGEHRGEVIDRCVDVGVRGSP